MTERMTLKEQLEASLALEARRELAMAQLQGDLSKPSPDVEWLERAAANLKRMNEEEE